MPRFEDAPEVETIARRVIQSVESHRWLAQVPIRYGIREADRPKTQHGRPVPGTVRVLSPYERWLAETVDELAPEATVVVEELPWAQAQPAEREAILDHLLSHLTLDDNGRTSLQGPDVAEFAAVIARRGAWHEGLARARDAWRERALPLEETDAALALQAPPGRVVPLRRAGGEG